MPIADAFRDYQLPSLPKAALEVLELVRSPDVDIRDLGRAIEHDPALASRLVRLGNSSLFGLSRQVTSLQQALVILGLRTVKLTALSFTLIKAFPGVGGEERFAEIWRRILTNASGCRLAADFFRVNREEAFLAGMVQDIGMLAFCSRAPEDYYPLIDQLRLPAGPRIHELELGRFGMTHAHLAAKLLEDWHFPEALVKAVVQHHDVDVLAALSGNKLDLAVLMAVMEGVTDFVLHPSPYRLDAIKILSLVSGGKGTVTEPATAVFLQRLDAQVSELADLLDLSLPGGRSYDEVLREAREMVESFRDAKIDLSDDPKRLFDSRTGVFHRDVLPHRLKQELALAKRHHWPFACILIKLLEVARLGNESKVNEALQVMRAGAGRIQATIRESDSLFQVSADTFCVFAPDARNEWVARIADRIKAEIASTTTPSQTILGQPAFGATTLSTVEQLVEARQLLATAHENLRQAVAKGELVVTEFRGA